VKGRLWLNPSESMRTPLKHFEEARSETLSLNTLVNQLLVNHAQFGRYLKRMNNLRLSRQTFTELINPLSEDLIIKAGQNAGNTAPQTLIAAIDGEMTVTNVIGLMHSLIRYQKLQLTFFPLGRSPFTIAPLGTKSTDPT
jgi:hypothetical protein